MKKKSIPIRILICTEDSQTCLQLEDILDYEFEDVNIHCINSREKFTECLNKRNFNIFILNWQVSWVDSVDLVKTVKENIQECPILMITPPEGESVAVKAMRVGLDGCLDQQHGRLMNVITTIHSVIPIAKMVQMGSGKSYKRLFDRIPICLYRSTPDGKILDANNALIKLLGYLDRETFFNVNSNELYVNPRVREKWVLDIVKLGAVTDLEFQLRRRDGRIIWVRENATAVKDSKGIVVYFEGCIMDITRQKEIENQLRLIAKVFEENSQGIFITDLEANLIAANNACLRITGFHLEEIQGKTIFDALLDRPESQFTQNIWKSLRKSEKWQDEIWTRRKNGEVYPIWLHLSAVRDNVGNISNYIGAFSDLTDQKMSEEFIEYLAHYDALTNLPNRLMFQEKLKYIHSQAKKESLCFAVVYLDLDRFQSINDTLGHFNGDALLQEIGKRFISSLKTGDIVARMGSDEFAFVFCDMSVVHNPEGFSDRIADLVHEFFDHPFLVEDREIFIAASAGVSVYPKDGSTSIDMIKKAELAMHHAKKSGGGKHQFFAASMDSVSMDHLNLEWSLRKAIEKNQLCSYFQPLVDLKNNLICGAETLLRWIHPEKGFIPPMKFIPMAESNGLIIPIGEYVLENSLKQVVDLWNSGFPKMAIAVNLSPRQFRDTKLISMIKRILDETGFDPEKLELEITESCLMDNIETTISLLKDLKKLGIKISIDDFGTGYSSLNYLKRFPIDKLKIDRSFIMDIDSDPNDEAIVKTIISLAHSLNLSVVAEGVETESQKEFLRLNDCDEMQGYLFSKPLPMPEFITLLKANRSMLPNH